MKPFVSVLVQCLEQTERAVCQAMFGFIDKGGFTGEKLHNTAGCSLQHKWFIGQWELEWKTEIQESGRIRESEEVKGRESESDWVMGK